MFKEIIVYKRNERFRKKVHDVTSKWNYTIHNIELVEFGKGKMDSGKISMIPFENSSRTCICAGIGDQINFEFELGKELKKIGDNFIIYLVDPTPKSIDYVKKCNLPKEYKLLPYAMVDEDKEIQFKIPDTEGWVSGSTMDILDDGRNLSKCIEVMGKSLTSIVRNEQITEVDLLKLDIEGAEFEVIGSILNADILVKEILVDFHHYILKDGLKKLQMCLDECLKAGYEIINVEDDYYSVTLIKKELLN